MDKDWTVYQALEGPLMGRKSLTVHTLKKNNFIYLFLALLGLGYTGYSLVVALGLLSAVASPVTEHGL